MAKIRETSERTLMYKSSLINYDVPVNTNRLNANIKAVPHTAKFMEDFGFTHRSNCWYWWHYLGFEISFNISISDDFSSIDIEVLDENFCQPYDYQRMLRKSSKNTVAVYIHTMVQKCMKRLLDEKIIEGYRLGDYI